MATIPKTGVPSLSGQDPAVIISGLIAGEAIAAGDPCYIAADGTAMKSNGTTLNAAAAKCDGMAAGAAPAGEGVTLYNMCEFRYGAGMTPGTRIFVSATAGLLSDAATTGGTAPIGFVRDATRIFIHGSRY